MTNGETILFWRFLENKGMKRNYLYFYDNHRFDGRSVEDFLEQTDAEDAILSAFDLAAAPNSIFSPRYWQQLNEKWFARLEAYRADGRMIDLPTATCQHCGRVLPRSAFAMNPKGLTHKHCRECEKNEKAMRQLEKEIAEKKARLERLSAASTPAPEAVPEAVPEPVPAEPAGPAATVKTEPEQKTAPRLGEHDATLHYKADSRKIVFNTVLSAYISAAGLTKCYLESKRDGRQFLIFNNSEGANVTWINTKASLLAQVCSTPHCRQIAEYFHLSIGELYYLHITRNLSKTGDVINVEIKEVHTREEFLAIAERREQEARRPRPVPGEDIPGWQDHDDAPLIDFSESVEPEPEPEPVKVKAAPAVPTTPPPASQRPSCAASSASSACLKTVTKTQTVSEI